MANHRPHVRVATKRALRAEAGGKCANPGCAAKRTELHHIEPWAVYQSHEAGQMIAICPTCHDAVHNGELEITDETLHRWKAIKRPATTTRGHVYVEPQEDAKLRLGSISVTGPAGLRVFELSAGNSLSFSVEDEDITLLSMRITDRRGEEAARLVQNHVRVSEANGVEYQNVPGLHVVTAPKHGRYLPNWVIDRIRPFEPDFAVDERITLLRLEVLEPGVVKVEGVWLEQDHGVVITPERMHLVRMDPAMPLSLSIGGADEDSGIIYTGPITSELFGFGP